MTERPIHPGIFRTSLGDRKFIRETHTLPKRQRRAEETLAADDIPYPQRCNFTENLEAAAHALSLPRQTRWNEQKDGDSVGDNRANRGRERYRGSDWNLFSAEAGGREFQGALSVSSGKNAVVYG